MTKKKHVLITLLFLLFFNIVLISTSAQQETTRNVEIDGDIDPEFIIHWRYNDFPNNTRADIVVGFVENAAENAWEKISEETYINDKTL